MDALWHWLFYEDPGTTWWKVALVSAPLILVIQNWRAMGRWAVGSRPAIAFALKAFAVGVVLGAIAEVTWGRKGRS